jgi:hypothetical protein
MAVPSGHFAGADIGWTMRRGGGAFRWKMKQWHQGSLLDGPRRRVQLLEGWRQRPSSPLRSDRQWLASAAFRPRQGMGIFMGLGRWSLSRRHDGAQVASNHLGDSDVSQWNRRLGVEFQEVASVIPRVTEILIKFLKWQLSPNARLNQDTKVWNQI